ncbi:MAG TPA: amino acid-binding protein [Gammaproteobacteria bacterium]|nr:amino acid-binding protein [Gammaproteobacteria bacterium]
MLTVVGEDRAGIVAGGTKALFEGGGNLGEASMMRLGGSFTIMLMVQLEGSGEELRRLVEPVARELSLHFHVDTIAGRLHRYLEPDVSVTVYGADRAGIVARVTGELARAGLHILELESDVAGSRDQPIYIMYIEGYAGRGMEALRAVLPAIEREGIEIALEPLETMVG